MNDEHFENLMRDAAHSFRKPPEPDLEAMWSEIEARTAWGEGRDGSTPVTPIASRVAPRYKRAALIAATLVVGVLLGRASMYVGRPRADVPVQAVASIASAPGDAPYDVETSRYLGQTAALLIALPSEVRAGRADGQFVARAGELLTRTRLLLDSPAANDPQMHDLLEDLELVLAQVVRLQNDTTSRTELDLISRALEQRDVIPRLRTAVADISAN